jgi:hypothetical protein
VCGVFEVSGLQIMTAGMECIKLLHSRQWFDVEVVKTPADTCEDDGSWVSSRVVDGVVPHNAVMLLAVRPLTPPDESCAPHITANRDYITSLAAAPEYGKDWLAPEDPVFPVCASMMQIRLAECGDSQEILMGHALRDPPELDVNCDNLTYANCLVTRKW